MDKQIIQTDNAPAPIGPYSQAVKIGGFLYISGQIAINPKTGNVETVDIESETKLVMSNLNAILEKAGLSFYHVIKTTIFLTDMSQFATVNKIYGSYFEKDFPARETVQASALPKGVHVEISMVAAG
jgi:2-iminobutanoate/2-iminopropanoate deaminase